jgi:hypothetical protein
MPFQRAGTKSPTHYEIRNPQRRRYTGGCNRTVERTVPTTSPRRFVTGVSA